MVWGIALEVWCGVESIRLSVFLFIDSRERGRGRGRGRKEGWRGEREEILM